MTRKLSVPFYAVLGVVGLAVAGACMQYLTTSEMYRWRARAAQVARVADSLDLVADSLDHHAAADHARADSLARLAARRDTLFRERIRILRDTVPVPDTCKVYVAARDSIIDGLLTNSDTMLTAFERQRLAFVTLQEALRLSRIATDSLQDVLGDVPTPLPAFIPTLSVGPFAGVCFNGQLCAGVGVGLTWDIPLLRGR